MTERTYAMARVKRGDYILPSNDANTLWRIASYEDGPTNGLDIPRDRTFWAAWKFSLPLTEWDRLDDPLDWDHWEQYESHCDTRAEAIAAVI